MTKELDNDLISTADFNSAVGIGSIINRSYIANVETVNGYDITEEEKAQAIQTLYKLSSEELQAYSREYPSISTVGPARYNVARGLRALDKKTEAAEKTRSFMRQLRNEQSEKRAKESQQRLVAAFYDAIQHKQKEFTCDGKEYFVRGRTRFIEKKYTCEVR